MTKETADEALMFRFCNDLDEKAFEQLIDRYYGRAISIAESRIFDSSAANDAVQESFIRVVKNRKKYDGRPFSSWFYTILRNVCTDYIRKEMRYKKKLETYAEEAPNPPSNPAAQAGPFQELTAGLEPRDRELMVYRFVQGLSFAECATLLECSEAAAKKRSQRALKKLQERLSPTHRDKTYPSM